MVSHFGRAARDEEPSSDRDGLGSVRDSTPHGGASGWGAAGEGTRCSR